jgi:hypothetical protein
MAQENVAHKAETAEQKLARLEAENAKLKEQIAKTPTGGVIRVKVTEARLPGTNGENDKGVATTGRISMYGVQRFPITLGIDSWNRIYAFLSGPEWKAFVAENSSKFSHKS